MCVHESTRDWRESLCLSVCCGGADGSSSFLYCMEVRAGRGVAVDLINLIFNFGVNPIKEWCGNL